MAKTIWVGVLAIMDDGAQEGWEFPLPDSCNVSSSDSLGAFIRREDGQYLHIRIDGRAARWLRAEGGYMTPPPEIEAADAFIEGEVIDE